MVQVGTRRWGCPTLQLACGSLAGQRGEGDAARDAQARPAPGSCWPGTGCALVQPALLLLTRCWALLRRSGSALSPSYQGEGVRGHRSHSTSVKLPLGRCKPLALTSAMSRGTAGHQQHPPRLGEGRGEHHGCRKPLPAAAVPSAPPHRRTHLSS